MEIGKRATALLVMAGLLLLLLASLFLFPARVPAGTVIGGIDFGGLSKQEAITRLASINDDFQQKSFHFQLGSYETISVSRADLGFSIDVYNTVDRLVQRESMMAEIFSSDVQAQQIKMQEVHPAIVFSEAELRAKLEEVIIKPEHEPVNARLQFKDNLWHVIDEKPGATLTRGELDRIEHEVIAVSYPATTEHTMEVTYDSVTPARTAADLAPVQSALNSYIEKPIVVQYAEEEVTLSTKGGNDSLPFTIVGSDLILDETKMREWIAAYATERNRDAGEVTITGVQTHESEYDNKTFERAVYEGAFESGWTVDEEKLLADIQAVVADAEKERVVSVELKSVAPTIVSEVEGLEFPDLLSVGRSNFMEGNGADRVKNITTSLSAMDTVIIPAGGEFSMGRVTGWITKDKGYTKTKVLFGGAVGYGVGGGVCQTSTTLYRAVLHAGLEVTERRPHSLDVSYYHKYGYGLDAAVFTRDRRDFRFENNTEHPILVKSYITPHDEAVVEIYGTSDGRIVQLENIPTGVRTYKKWKQTINWPDREVVEYITTRYPH